MTSVTEPVVPAGPLRWGSSTGWHVAEGSAVRLEVVARTLEGTGRKRPA